MKKLLDKMADIPKDKLLHIMWGMVIFAVVWFVLTIHIALGVVIVVAVAKEVYDEVTYGGFDTEDIIATVILPIVVVLLETIK